MPSPLQDWLGLISTAPPSPMPGDMIMRSAAGGWTTFNPGAKGSVMTIDPNSGLPGWLYSGQLVFVSSQLGQSNGVDDTNTINAALVSGGYIKGQPGQTYKISAPLKIPANTTLDMTNCTVAFANTSVHCNMLQNAAVTPVSTATDVITTAGSNVVTSPTLAAVAAVGQQIGVVGAGPNGPVFGQPIWLYGTVQSVSTSTNQITLTGNVNGVAASLSLSGATGYLFNRDKNIVILGGLWDLGSNWTTLASRQAGGVNTHAMRLRRIDRLVVHDVSFSQASLATQTGWCYGVNPADCTDFLIERIYSQPYPGQTGNYGINDAVQGTGPLYRGIIRDIQGTTQDDQVAIGQADNDAASNNLVAASDTEGDIVDVLIDGVTSYWTVGAAVALFAGYGGNNAVRVMDRVTVRSIKGQTQSTGVRLVDWIGQSWIAGVLIEDVSVIPGFFPPYSNPMILLAASKAQTVVLKNILWPYEAGSGNAGVINVTKAPQQLDVDGLTIRGTSTNGADGVKIAANAGTINTLTISKVRQPDINVSHNIVYVDVGNTINRITISDAFVKGTNSSVVVNNSVSTISELIVRGIRMETTGGNGLFDSHAAASSNLINIKASDVYCSAGFAWLGQPANIFLDRVEMNQGAYVIYVSGASATPVNITARGLQLDNSPVIYGKDGSQSVTATGIPSLQSGTATLTAGVSSSIAATSLTANGRIRLTNIKSGGTVGALYATITAGTGFVIHSTSGTDTSTVFWEIVQY